MTQLHAETELVLRLAETDADRRGAERLRYRVFVEELGGQGADVDHAGQLERDRFDEHCDQLVLIDPLRDAGNLEHVVGVYRLLRSEQAETAGGFYSEAEYDLTPLQQSGRRLLELGRSCLHPDFRGGTAMFQMWQGLADYVFQHQIEILFGVASFHGTHVQQLAQPLAHLYHAHRAPPELCPRARVYQTMNLMAEDAVIRATAMKATPALIKAYLRLGGLVGDGAFIDYEFNTIDVCLVMDTARMSAKHRDLYAKGKRL